MHQKPIKAEKTGVLLQTISGRGEVVSVYSKALNIRYRDRLLVSLVKKSTQMTALSVSVPSLFLDLETQEATVRPGDKVRFGRDRWAINGFQVRLAAGEPWTGSLDQGDVEGFRFSNIPVFEKALLLKGRKDGLLGLIHPQDERNLFVRKASPAIDQILRDRDNISAIKGLSRMVGLGVGFTPSGDDFIAGVLLGEKILNLLFSLHMEVPETAQDPITPHRIDKEEIWSARCRTSDGGWTLLYQALQGHFPCYLIEAVRGLACARNFEEMRGAIEGAVSHGETSGTDALAGLWFYLAKLGNNHSYVV